MSWHQSWLGQQVPGGTGATDPSSQWTTTQSLSWHWTSSSLTSLSGSQVTSYRSLSALHMVRLGQHLPGGEGAMEPSLHLSTRHLTAPQSSTWHWVEEGQHSPLAMGARDPSEQNSGIQALASQSAMGQREGSGQQ